MESNEEEGEKLSEKMILFLKLLDLEPLLFSDLGMEFLLLNRDSIAIKADIFLVRTSKIEAVGWTSAHGTPCQKPLRPAVFRHPYQKPEEKEGNQEGNSRRDFFKPGLEEAKEDPFPSDEMGQKPGPEDPGV